MHTKTISGNSSGYDLSPPGRIPPQQRPRQRRGGRGGKEEERGVWRGGWEEEGRDATREGKMKALAQSCNQGSASGGMMGRIWK